jgi:hypothetical protein
MAEDIPDLNYLNVGYGLDNGGYEFEHPKHETLKGCAVWDDPDVDLIPWILGIFENGADYWGLSCPLYVFRPSVVSVDVLWPKALPDEDFPRRLVGHGKMNGTSRECHCHGQPGEDGWEFTGNVDDTPYPDCNRCGGTGYVDSPSGHWALYALEEN